MKKKVWTQNLTTKKIVKHNTEEEARDFIEFMARNGYGAYKIIKGDSIK